MGRQATRWAVSATALVVALSALLLAPSAQAGSGDLVVNQYGLGGTPTVSRVDPANGNVHTIASGSPLTSASYLTFEPNGKIAVTDENKPGIFTVDPATGGIHKLGGGGLVGPYGIDTDADGNLIVAAYGDNGIAGTEKVVRVNRRTGHVHTILASGWLGSPQGVAVNRHSGKIFVADSGDGVDRLSPNGNLSTVASGSPFSYVWAITRAPDGMLYVTDNGNDTLFSVNPQTGAVDPVASLGPQPFGVAAATNRIVYVTDFGDGTVSRVNVTTGHVSPVASGLVNPLGITIQP